MLALEQVNLDEDHCNHFQLVIQLYTEQDFCPILNNLESLEVPKGAAQPTTSSPSPVDCVQSVLPSKPTQSLNEARRHWKKLATVDNLYPPISNLTDANKQTESPNPNTFGKFILDFEY